MYVYVAQSGDPLKSKVFHLNASIFFQLLMQTKHQNGGRKRI